MPGILLTLVETLQWLALRWAFARFCDISAAAIAPMADFARTLDALAS